MEIVNKIIDGMLRAVDTNPVNALWLGLLALGLLALGLLALVLTVRALGRVVARTTALLTSRKKEVDTGESPGQNPKPKIDPVTLIVALIAFGVSGQGMFMFFGDKMGLWGNPLHLGFIVLEAMAFSCALRIRNKAARNQPAGVDWWIMWGIAVLSGLMSATEATSAPEAFLRLLMPVIAGVAWELALMNGRNLVRERLERAHERSRAVLAFAPKRLLAKLGWMDASGRSLDEVVRERVITKAALTSDRYLTLKETLTSASVSADGDAHEHAQVSARNVKALMRARSSARKRWRIATEQAGLGTDPVTTKMFIKKLAMLREFDRLDLLEFGDVWEVANQAEPQVSTEREALSPPPDPQRKRRQNNRILPAGQNGVPAKAREYWVEIKALTNQEPTTSQLVSEGIANSKATARRWASVLRSEDLSALISAARAGAPKALTSANGHAHPSAP